MQRTTAPYNLNNHFTDGPPGTDVEKTWLNSVQEEICNLIEDASITLDVNDQTQLTQAVDNKISALTMPGGYVALSSGCISYKDADELYIEGNRVDCAGKVCYWNSQLTYDVGSPAVSTWYYLYLDYSEITSNVEITITEIITSTTAPTYSHSLKGYYNGNDRCIGCFLTDGSGNITKFYWDKTGEYFWDDRVLSLSSGSQTTFTDVDLSASVPNLGDMAVNLLVFIRGTATQSSGVVRKNGQTVTDIWTGTIIIAADIYNEIWRQTDSSQIIEYVISGGTTYMTIYNIGFKLKI